MQNLLFYLAFKQGRAGSRSTTYLLSPARPVATGSDGHLGTFWARPASESVQNHPDPHGNRAQNTDLDALNPTILFIRRETAGKAGTTFGFHPTKLSVGPTTTRAGIIIPHYPQGGVGENTSSACFPDGRISAAATYFRKNARVDLRRPDLGVSKQASLVICGTQQWTRHTWTRDPDERNTREVLG